MGHMLVTEASQEIARHEADRYKFVGRNHTLRNPLALSSEQYLSGTTGVTLDPIFSLGQIIELDPNGSADISYLTFAGESREAIIAQANRYRSRTLIDSIFSPVKYSCSDLAWKTRYYHPGIQRYSQTIVSLDVFI